MGMPLDAVRGKIDGKEETTFDSERLRYVVAMLGEIETSYLVYSLRRTLENGERVKLKPDGTVMKHSMRLLVECAWDRA